jgi:DNA-binding NarL/FixJ family response regulator
VKLRIVIADDNPAVLRQYLFLMENEFDIVATAPDGALALEAIRCFRPDVAVLDIAMPVLGGIDLTKILQREPYCPAVVICTIENDQEFIEAAQYAGALGYVFKTHVAKDLIVAVKLAANGQSFVSRL